MRGALVLVVLSVLVLVGCLGPGVVEYQISGVIEDGLGDPLAGVELTIAGPSIGTAIVTSGPDGAWQAGPLEGQVVITPAKPGYAFDPASAEASAASDSIDFIATLQGPWADPAPGMFADAQTVALEFLDGWTIYFTTDGEDPTSSSEEYTGPIEISETTTIKAVAIDGENESSVFSGEYVIALEYYFDDFSGSQEDIDNSWYVSGDWQWDEANSVMEFTGDGWTVLRWGHGTGSNHNWLEGGPGLETLNRNERDIIYSSRIQPTLTSDRGAEVRLVWMWNTNRRYQIKFYSDRVQLRYQFDQDVSYVLAEESHSLSSGDWIDVKWIVRGYEMEVFINDMTQPLITFSEEDAEYDYTEDAQMNTMYAGFGAGGQPVVVDWVELWSLAR